MEYHQYRFVSYRSTLVPTYTIARIALESRSKYNVIVNLKTTILLGLGLQTNDIFYLCFECQRLNVLISCCNLSVPVLCDVFSVIYESNLALLIIMLLTFSRVCLFLSQVSHFSFFFFNPAIFMPTSLSVSEYLRNMLISIFNNLIITKLSYKL